MKLQSSLIRWSLVGLLALTGCRWTTTVQQVQSHPRRQWWNSTVYLQGTVGDRAPLLQGQLYELQDATGKIWVLSQSPYPPRKSGERVQVKGQVRYQEIKIGEQNFEDVYIEEERLEPES